MPHREVDRRRFLRLATVGTMTGAALGQAPRAKADVVPPQVLIIGGGMAGASTAFWLRVLGIPAVILEAQPNMGGRIRTSTLWSEAPLDLGAAWIHDSVNSPLTPLTQLFKIQTFLTDFTFKMFGSQNQLLSDDQVAKIAYDYLLMTSVVKWYTAVYRGFRFPDQPLSNLMSPVFGSMNLPVEEATGVQTFIDNTVRNHFGVEVRELSLYNYDQDRNLTQVFDRAFPGGYIQLVNALWGASQQPTFLNCQVKQLRYDGPTGVTAVTNQGNFSARCAVVTLPIGVLQRSQGSNPLVEFVPQLPFWKLFAINGLQMGVWDKLAMRFDTNFWGPYQLLKNSQPHSQPSIWFNPAPMLNQPVLVPVVHGDTARMMQTMTDNQVQSFLMGILNPWFNAQGTKVGNLTGFQRSSWGTNPFSYGCYPHIAAGASGVHYDLMSLPVPFAGAPPRLFFAGDGTHRDHCGSVWGAYESGVREAMRVWSFLRTRTRTNTLDALPNRQLSTVKLPAKFHPSVVWKASQANLKEANKMVNELSKGKK